MATGDFPNVGCFFSADNALKQHIAKLEAENKSYYDLVEGFKEVLFELQTENKRMEKDIFKLGLLAVTGWGGVFFALWRIGRM